MMKISKFLLAACALCLLRGSADSQEGAASPAGGGLDVEECLSQAVKNNPEIKISRQEVAAAKGDRLSAISGFLPKLQFKGAAQRQSEGSFASDLLATQVGSSVKRSPELYHLGLEFEQHPRDGAQAEPDEDHRCGEHCQRLDRRTRLAEEVVRHTRRGQGLHQFCLGQEVDRGHGDAIAALLVGSRG